MNLVDDNIRQQMTEIMENFRVNLTKQNDGIPYHFDYTDVVIEPDDFSFRNNYIWVWTYSEANFIGTYVDKELVVKFRRLRALLKLIEDGANNGEIIYARLAMD